MPSHAWDSPLCSAHEHVSTAVRACCHHALPVAPATLLCPLPATCVRVTGQLGRRLRSHIHARG
eukprot:948091-Pleurochrysis_carterae.AAC.1